MTAERGGAQEDQPGLRMGRRSFLKMAGVAVGGATVGAHSIAITKQNALPAIPTLDELASVSMRHRYTDLFNMPVFSNEWGYGQASKSVSGVTGITFPPYACCGVPDVTWSPGLLTSCEITMDGQLLSIAAEPDGVVTYRWLQQRVDREQTVRGMHIRTKTFMPVKCRAVAERIEIVNLSPERKKMILGFNLQAAVIKKTTAWVAGCPGEGENAASWSGENSRITFVAQHSAASSAQGILPPAHRAEAGHVLTYDLDLRPGESRVFHYVNAIADTPQEANALHDSIQHRFDAAFQENEDFYAELLRAVFTPGNRFFSGYLPTLHTSDPALRDLYLAGIKNLLSARRVSPDSRYGATYITLTGHTLPTLSFPWDTSLCSLSLALLDPLVLRRMVEVWLEQPMHEHLATDYITGEGVGPWYAVNDTAILTCARNYLSVTRDLGWLNTQIAGHSVLQHLENRSLYWESLQRTNRGLADYGKIENLLEVVSTYIHEVAGMNAGNVANMRFVAELLERDGQRSRAGELRSKSAALAQRINALLYVQGKGYWRCGQPDGSFNEVRHCYDFLAVADSMRQDLGADQKREMTAFFWRELRTQKWMRALASGDPDATWNIRPDHSCLGAYASWPAMSVKALYELGFPSQQTAEWLRELSKAGNQGPIGQAHFTEGVFPPEKGGAFKCPNDPPYINEWACIAGGAFTDMVIDTVFGVKPTLDNVTASPQLAEFDVSAQLQGLRCGAQKFVVQQQGLHSERT